MEELKKRIYIELAIWLTVILALLSGTFFFKSSVDKTAGLLDLEREKLAERISKIALFARLKNQYEAKAKNYLSRMEQQVPTKDRIIDLPREFQFLASGAGVALTFSFLDEKDPADEGLGSIGFRLNAVGDFNSIITFVNSLENFRFLILVESLNLSFESERYQATLVGRIFYR